MPGAHKSCRALELHPGDIELSRFGIIHPDPDPGDDQTALKRDIDSLRFLGSWLGY